MGPEPAEVEEADREQIEQVDAVFGSDGPPAEEGKYESGGDEEHGEKQKGVVSGGGEPAQKSHRPRAGAMPCRRPHRTRIRWGPSAPLSLSCSLSIRDFKAH